MSGSYPNDSIQRYYEATRQSCHLANSHNEIRLRLIQGVSRFEVYFSNYEHQNKRKYVLETKSNNCKI